MAISRALFARKLDPEHRQHDAYEDHACDQPQDQPRTSCLAERVGGCPKPEDGEPGDDGSDDDDHRCEHGDAIGGQLEQPRHREHQPADKEARQRGGSRAHDDDFNGGYPPLVPEPSYSSGDDYVVEFLGFRFSFNAFDFEQRVTAAAVKLGLVEGNDLDEDETADLVELTADGRIAAPRSGLGMYLVRHWEQLSLIGGESLVYWLRKLVFRGAWLDHWVKDGRLEVAWEDETGEFAYVDPRGDRALLEAAPIPSWHEVQFRR
jgi:hypothetical protein